MSIKVIKEMKMLLQHTNSNEDRLLITLEIIKEQDRLISKWQAAGEKRAQDLVNTPISKLSKVKGIRKCTCGWSNKDVPRSAHSSWCDKVN